MTPRAANLRTDPTASAEAPRGVGTIWGLTTTELHDAFWRSRGVQCVRRDVHATLDRDAELYLLLESDQLVYFDLASISDRLMWHDAMVTRLHLLDTVRDPYAERVQHDDDGRVQRVARTYTGVAHGSSRVMLTTKRRLASMWVQAPSRRAGWDRVRRGVPWSRVDHERCAGRLFRAGDAADEAALIDELVLGWRRPDRGIEGLTMLEPGVWRRDDASIAPPSVCTGPLWLGDRDAGGACLIGPQWCADDPASNLPALCVRAISEIEADETRAPRTALLEKRWYPAVKRAMDIVVSAGLLAALAPLMGVIALLIWLEDRGPLFFGHERQGRGGRSFRCWKFRSMHVDAERIAQELAAYNVCDGPQVFIRDDPRVTRIGRVLRTTHLDELPQLWNVLVGQMSLVGPRPSPERENQYCPAWRDLRLSVRPGITGLWQVRRTREPGEDFQEWIRYDIDYVRRAGLWLDVRILLRTVAAFFAGRIDSAAE